MKKLFLFLAVLGTIYMNITPVKADTIQFKLHVTSSTYSESTPSVKKSDWDPAVANILGGLGWGRSVHIRVRTTAEGEPATYLYEAGSNGRYPMSYLSGYGTVGRYYHLNASKKGPLNATITGRFAP